METQKITEIVQDSLTALGFDLVKITLRSTSHKILEILIDRIDGKNVSVADCREVNRNISAFLDVENIISDKYFLEVSSAGIERPLVKFTDYVRFIGREANIKLKELLNGCSRYQGQLVKAEDNKIYLICKGEEVVVPFDLIKKASLVLTDEMFRKLMNKNLKRQ